MRKILVTIDALNLDNNTLDFACYIARLSKSRLTGIFLENLVAEELREMEIASTYGNEINYPSQRNEIAENNIKSFREICEKRGVMVNIHRKRGRPITEIISESRFADMIIVEARLSFRNRIEGTPSAFARELFEKAECPVIIVPESFDGVDEIIFSYDGSRSSVLAMRQFSYLFPQFQTKKVTVLEVNKNDDLAIHSKQRISEWLKTHYSDLSFAVLNGDCSDELFKYLIGKHNLFLVMGAFGRGTLSTLVRSSHAELILKTADFPLFVAHR